MVFRTERITLEQEENIKNKYFFSCFEILALAFIFNEILNVICELYTYLFNHQVRTEYKMKSIYLKFS